MAKPYVNHTRRVPRNTAANTIFQGAVIDNNGREIPITEQMILDACKALEPAASSIYTSEIIGRSRMPLLNRLWSLVLAGKPQSV